MIQRIVAVMERSILYVKETVIKRSFIMTTLIVLTTLRILVLSTPLKMQCRQCTTYSSA